MKKAFKILGVVLLIVLIAIGALAFKHRKYISAFIEAKYSSSEQIKEKIAQNDEKLKKELEGYMPDMYREYTEDEKAQIESGEVSEKEIMAKIISENLSAEDKESGKKVTDNTPQKTPEPEKPSADKIIAGYVSQMYSLEGKYVGGIEGVISRAHAEYVKTAEHEKDTAAMAAVGAKYIGEIYALESSCDGEVESILANLRSELEAIGADTSVVSTMREAYNNEKQLKRSYYMGLYMN